MSLEAALAENTATLKEHMEVLKEVAQNQGRLLLASQTAIDKVEAPKATRTRKAKDDAPAAEPEKNEEPAGTASGAGDASSASDEVTTDALLGFATSYLNEFNPKVDGNKNADPAKYQARGKFLMGMLSGEFGVAKIPEIAEADDRKRALFYLKRFVAGKDVDFKVDYDFDGEPDQDVAAGEDFDIG